ncbi:Unknown protein, partial [Striga hermonthica]
RRARPSEGRTDVRRASVAVDDTPPRAEVKPTVGDGTRTTSNYRRLTEDEIQRRREKGLCFTCNEKVVPGHKCKGKEIFLLEIEEEREEEKPQEESWLHMAKCNKRGPRMIRFTAEIKDMLLEVLVDSGSSLNFIDEGIARKLKLVPTKVKKFGVKVANGHELQGSQLFKKVPITAQDHELEIDLYALPLKTTYIVLGVQWLETLGPITTDYKRGKMKLERGKEKVDIQPGGEVEKIQMVKGYEERKFRIEKYLEEPIRSKLIDLVRDFADIFAYTVEELTGISADVIVHRLNIDLSVRP